MRQATPSSITRRTWIAGAAALKLSASPPEAVRLPQKVRLALLGLDGHTGEILSHLPELPDVELVAVSDSDPDKLARVARNPRLAQAKRYTDYRQLLDQERLDMAAVCGNNGERAAVVLACSEHKLHIIAEKPLAVERADLEKIRKAVARAGTRVSMLLGMRFSPPYLALKKVVESGEIGEVVQIGGQKSYKAGQRPEWQRRHATFGGTIPWVGIHMADLMRWTSGREFIEAASFQSHIGFPELGDMENTAASLFLLDNGGVGTLRMDYLRPETAPTHGDDRLRLAGLKGVAEYGGSGGITVMSADRKPEVIQDLPPAGSVFLDFLESVYKGKPPHLSMDDVFRICEIVLVAREAAEQHRILKI